MLPHLRRPNLQGMHSSLTLRTTAALASTWTRRFLYLSSSGRRATSTSGASSSTSCSTLSSSSCSPSSTQPSSSTRSAPCGARRTTSKVSCEIHVWSVGSHAPSSRHTDAASPSTLRYRHPLIQKRHNIFNYVRFLAFLNRKDPNDYTGLESYVASKLRALDFSWIPSHD